jgi:hypothetical protein
MSTPTLEDRKLLLADNLVGLMSRVGPFIRENDEKEEDGYSHGSRL